MESWDRCNCTSFAPELILIGSNRFRGLWLVLANEVQLTDGSGAHRGRPPVTPGVTGAVRQSHRELQGPIRGHEICFNQSECVQVQMRCNWRTAPVTPGVTGGRRRCAPALSAKSHRSQLSTDWLLKNSLQPIGRFFYVTTRFSICLKMALKVKKSKK